MDNVNQSTIFPKAFPPQPDVSGINLMSQRTSAWHQTVLKMATWVEIIVGASFILVPNVQSQFLFAATPEELAISFWRFAGIALIGLGIACLPSNSGGTHRGAVRGLLIFNIGATIFFAWVAVSTTFRGVMLVPVVILHTVIALALALALKHEGR